MTERPDRFERLSQMFEAPPVTALSFDARAPVSRSLKALLYAVIDRLRPGTIAEVGAFEADFARAMTSRHPEASVVAFEASPIAYSHHRDALAEAGIDYRHLAIGAESGTATIHVPTQVRGRTMPTVNRMASLNAIAVPDSLTEAHEVPLRRLDDELAGTPGRAALWIDVEGAVAGVLAGAPQTLERTAIVLCELESAVVWEGQALAGEVVERLRAKGLVPVARDCEKPDQHNALFLSGDAAEACEDLLADFEARTIAFVQEADTKGDPATGASAPAKPAAPAAPTAPDGRVALRDRFDDALGAKDAALVEKAKLAIRRATGAIYGRPTLNPMHNGHCINMLGASLPPLRERLGGTIDYLEIGSFQGASMVTMGTLMKGFGIGGRRVSIDPYFDEGYTELQPGTTEPFDKQSTPDTMARAAAYYEQAGLEVEIVRDTSASALHAMAEREERFGLIFIDGKHEQLGPLGDLALAMRLLAPGGHVMLDDVNWPDVRPLYDLCRRHMTLVTEGFHKAVFTTDDPMGLL